MHSIARGLTFATLALAAVACTNPVEPEPDYRAAWSGAVDAWMDREGWLAPACLRAWSDVDIIETDQFGPLCERPAGRVVACTLIGERYLVQINPGLSLEAKCDAMGHESGHVLRACSGYDPDPMDTDPTMWIDAAPTGAWTFEADALARGTVFCMGEVP